MSTVARCLIATLVATSICAGSAHSDCPWLTYPNTFDPSRLVVADFNNDGKQDLAIANSGIGRVGTYLGNGDGTFQLPLNSPELSGISHLVATDFNRDGNADIAVNGRSVGAIYVLYGLGTGTFQDPVAHPVGDSPLGLTSGDFNGDDILDLASATFPNTVSVILGLEGGGFGPASSYPSVGFFSAEIESASSRWASATAPCRTSRATWSG